MSVIPNPNISNLHKQLMKYHPFWTYHLYNAHHLKQLDSSSKAEKNNVSTIIQYKQILHNLYALT